MLTPLRHALLTVVLVGFMSGCGEANSAKSSRAEADFNAIGSAILTYKINAGALPPPELGLKALVERPPSLDPGKPWSQTIKEVPLDPWNNPYRYLAGDSFERGFGLYSSGPDGVSKSMGNDPDDLNSWSGSRRSEPDLWRNFAKPLMLAGGLVIATGAFMVGYRVAKREMRRA